MKSTVFIIKSGPWKYSRQNRNHPEYAAIFDLIEHYNAKFRFVLVGSSNAPTKKLQLNHSIVAWDIQKGKLGGYTYFLELTKLLFQYRPHIVIVLGLSNILPVAIYSLFSRKFKYIPVFIGEFGYYRSKSAGRSLFHLTLKALGISLKLSQRKIHTSFTLSRYTREGIKKLAPNFSGKIRLVSYPIHPKFYSKQEHLPFRLYKEPVLLTVAAIEPRKGLDTLIKAVSLIKKKFRVSIRGRLSDTDYLRRLNNMVNSLNLKKKVTFFTEGVVYDALVSQYQSATLFVFPTREDSLGVVILEALHCGVPVIATSVGGIPDMIEDGVNGILVRPDEPVELAKAISLLLDNEVLRGKLAANARRTLIDRYYKGRITLKDALIQSIENI